MNKSQVEELNLLNLEKSKVFSTKANHGGQLKHFIITKNLSESKLTSSVWFCNLKPKQFHNLKELFRQPISLWTLFSSPFHDLSQRISFFFWYKSPLKNKVRTGKKKNVFRD